LLALLAPASGLLLWAAASDPDARFLTIQDPIVVYNNWSSYDELSDKVPLTEKLAMKELDQVLRLRRERTFRLLHDGRVLVRERRWLSHLAQNHLA
jgi:hypothetical protein